MAVCLYVGNSCLQYGDQHLSTQEGGGRAAVQSHANDQNRWARQTSNRRDLVLNAEGGVMLLCCALAHVFICR